MNESQELIDAVDGLLKVRGYMDTVLHWAIAARDNPKSLNAAEARRAVALIRALTVALREAVA